MKLRVTSITDSEVGKLINAITTALEDRLRPLLEPKQYGGGIEQLTIFFISVDSDPLENERYCSANNRSGRYKDMLTGKSVRYLGIAIPIDPQVVLSSSRAALHKLAESKLLETLETPPYAMPKQFDQKLLFSDVKAELSL